MALPSLGCIDVSVMVGGVEMIGLPWWTKMGVKLGLGMTPFSYETIRSTLTGKRGGMESLDYARATFGRFVGHSLDREGAPQGGTLMELGPGGSLLTGFFAKAFGFNKCILVDVGDFAVPDKEFYQSCASILPEPEREEFVARLARGEGTFQSLEAIGIHYSTTGVDALRSLSPGSIDFSFSNAVLEHVKKKDFEGFWDALYVAHREGSVSAHQIDYKDHLGGGLNNLRFPGWLWESKYFSNDGFYTNRLRHSEVVNFCEKAGFRVLQEDSQSWDVLPLSKRSLAAEFQKLDESDLRIKDAFITLQKSV